jgi:hypothetical protein
MTSLLMEAAVGLVLANAAFAPDSSSALPELVRQSKIRV